MKYAIQVPRLDERNQALVQILNSLVVESGRVEHCEDLSDLLEDLLAVTRGYLDALSGHRDELLSQVAGQRGAVAELVCTRLPLPARDGPACRDCGLCDVLEAEACAWLCEDLRWEDFADVALRGTCRECC